MNEHKPTRTTTLHTTMNTNAKPFEPTNSSTNSEKSHDYIENSTRPCTQTKLETEYYNSSLFFAKTFNAAALCVKAEMAAEQGAPRRRGRRDSVHDGAFEEESMGGVSSL
ncbi:hypothetical protein Q7P36_006458 [Cladosporium allicinum]